MNKYIYVAVMILVVGCTSLLEKPVQPTIDLMPDAEGIAIGGSNLRIDFGRHPKGVITAFVRELGSYAEMDILSCPVEVTRQLGWQNLILSFSREKFVGWRKLEASAGRVCSK